eukprot:gene56810-77863_t
MSADNFSVEQCKRKFIDFLVDERLDGKYSHRIEQCIREKKRFILNINDVRADENDWASRLIRRPREHMIALQEAVIETGKNLNPEMEKLLRVSGSEPQVGLDGSFGLHSVTPRGLTSNLLNTLVEVEGIVTKCSSVRPKLIKSVQYCPTTNSYSQREYRDMTSIDIGIEVRTDMGEKLPSSAAMATRDADNNPLEIEYGLCQYKDYQSLVIQEMPEK